MPTTPIPRIDTTLSKGIGLLEALAASPRPLGVTELAMRLDLNKSNVHRLLRSLGLMGYVRQEPDRSYRCTLKIWQLGIKAIAHVDLAHLAAGALQDLARLSRETVHLTALDGNRAVYLETIHSLQTVRAYTERGGVAPFHCVATGKVLLAYNYAALRGMLMEPLQRHTARTLTRLAELDAEVGRIRKVGIALDFGEFHDDVGGAAAPVHDPAGRVIAAIGICGPITRLTRLRVRELAPALGAAARHVTEALAGRRAS
jgi:DNA-binding IclR family transcriptional regulator